MINKKRHEVTYMLLDRERARVERDTKDLDAWHELSPSTAHREGHELGDE
jgi:hypothetical protein